jgi:aspartokinase
VETVAVYWEDRVKTYGFSEVAGLALVQWTVPPEALPGVGGGIEDMAVSDGEMLFVLGHGSANRAMEFGLLVERRLEDRTVRRVRGFLGEALARGVSSLSPAGLINFHGPHFGDRYGIAHAALKALMECGAPVLAVGCSASSIYLVLPEDRMETAMESLSKAFVRPER